jgi:hypothetical protein
MSDKNNEYKKIVFYYTLSLIAGIVIPLLVYIYILYMVGFR